MLHRWLAATKVVRDEIGVRGFFFSFCLSSVSQAYLSYDVFVCSCQDSLLPHKPELVSSTLPVVVKLRFLAFVDCSCFFSYPSQYWRSTTFDRKTPACLDVGRQLDSIGKLPGGKVWTLTLVQVLGSVNRPRSCATIACSNTDELLPRRRPVRRPLSPPPCQPVTLHSAFTAVPKLLCHH